MSAEFLVAYQSVKDLSRAEARERLEMLKRYFLSTDKDVSCDYFAQLFSSVLSIPSEKLSLVPNPHLLFIYAYNLLLRKAKGEELVKEEGEYAFIRQYEELVSRFPDVDIDTFDEEVLSFLRGKERKKLKPW